MQMTTQELETYRRDGYLVRRDVFSANETAALGEAVEQVVREVMERATARSAARVHRIGGHRVQFAGRTGIQWEWREASDDIRALEPVFGLHPLIDQTFVDSRLTSVMADAVGADAVSPFTSKINLKRRREGSPFLFHQDYPYWFVHVGELAREIATVMIFLDDATADNGALRVVAGSHLVGPAPRAVGDHDAFVADPQSVDSASARVIEVPAGGILLFGSLLLHGSPNNLTAQDRRALLVSFQPSGRPRLQHVPYRRELVEQLP